MQDSTATLRSTRTILTGHLRRRRTRRPHAPALVCELVKVARHLSPGGLSLAELLDLPAADQVQLVHELPAPIRRQAVRHARRRRLWEALRSHRTGRPVATLPTPAVRAAGRQLLLFPAAGKGGAR